MEYVDLYAWRGSHSACLCPDVLVKGADYTIDRVVGADFVQARGGKVLLVNLQPGHSTTTTVTKIKAA